MPLVMIKENEIVEIIKITAKPEQKKHLEELGFLEGTQVNVISNNDGDIILKIKGYKLTMTKEMAQKIIVKIIK